ncbi:putative DNA-binding domain-containing protein [Novosphingobium sp.]|uniref:HvfC/BufC family peptide modification chaperone n=1 Tax=Novosphingobium sp. TaxID=1874826 RepID=UPI003BAC2B4D
MPELAALRKDPADQRSQPLPMASSIQVYRNPVLLRAVDVLAGSFPVTREIVGARKFEALALAFVRHGLPDIRPAAHLFRDFPEWLAREAGSRVLPCLPDVARCELLHIEALSAPDGPALSIEDLARLPPEQQGALKLKAHPSTRFAWLATPAMTIWLAYRNGCEERFVPERRSGGAIFARQGADVVGFELDPPSHRLLVGLRMGETVGHAAQAASQLYPDANVGVCLNRLAACGAFAALAGV